MKKRMQILWRCVSACFVCMLLVGCSSTRYYDLSPVAPFSAYAGQDVRLTREMLLVDHSEPNVQQLYCMLEDPAGSYCDPIPEWAKVVRLPVGTKVRVMGTYAVESAGYAVHWGLSSMVMVRDLEAEGWPKEVPARFDDTFAPAGRYRQMSAWFRGEICPAPWEPPDTPAVRKIAMPAADLRISCWPGHWIRGSMPAATRPAPPASP